MFFFFSSRRRHTIYIGDWSSDVCSSDLTFTAWSVLVGNVFNLIVAQDSDALHRDDEIKYVSHQDRPGGERRAHVARRQIRSEERRVGRECWQDGSADC